MALFGPNMIHSTAMKNYRALHGRVGSPSACRAGPSRHRRTVVASAVESVGARNGSAGINELVSLLKLAATVPKKKAPGLPPAGEVLEAIVKLEKLRKPLPEGWEQKLTVSGRNWRLAYSADAGDVAAASKGQPHRGGYYFPIPAAQRFSADGEFDNGIYLGSWAYLAFSGPFVTSGKQLSFDVVDMHIGLGPWKISIPLKKGTGALVERSDADRKALPFFIYIHVDDNIAVARGRGGGVAVWQRTTPDWDAQAGILKRLG